MKNKGFTIVELLIVMMIIIIVATVSTQVDFQIYKKIVDTINDIYDIKKGAY